MGEYLKDLSYSFGQYLLSGFFFGIAPILAIGLSVSLLCTLVIAHGAGPVDKRAIKAFAIIGATAGLMIGTSESSIVQVALPALLTLVSTFLAYLYAKEKPTPPAIKSPFENLPKIEMREFTPAIKKSVDDHTKAMKDVMGRTEFIPAGIIALALASGGGTFFGVAMRSVDEANDRAYNEWLLRYQQIELPLNADLLRRKAGLPIKGAEEAAKANAATAEATKTQPSAGLTGKTEKGAEQ